jgi:ABC-type phosphate/phosphonate transport system ATPase subunit
MPRNRVIYDVICMLNSTNLVQVYGLPGMGKSTIIRFVGNYLAERNHFRDGALFIDMKSVCSFDEFLIQLYENMSLNLPTPPLMTL